MPAIAQLTIESDAGTQRFPLGIGSYLIGTEPGCDLVVSSLYLRPRHARLTVAPDHFLVEDCAGGGAPRRHVYPQEVDLGPLCLRLERSTETAGKPTDRPAGRYAIGEEIARGGMGAILEATDNVLGRTIAMKVVLAEKRGRTLHSRFIREATVLARLAHPNIVPVYELGQKADGAPYYTMKMVTGRTLHDITTQLREGDPATLAKYPLNELLDIFQKVCDAMAFAHSRGIIHRDLKPQNIMVGEFGEVFVMDWGLAKFLPRSAVTEEAAEPLRGPSGQTGPTGTLRINSLAAEDRVTLATGPDEADEASVAEEADSVEDATVVAGSGAAASAPRLRFVTPGHAAPGGVDATLEGAVMGTPHYMAPEQAEGRVAELDAQSDIFSLGAILYTLLTLRRPVEGDTVADILAKVRHGKVTPPASFNTPESAGRSGAAAPGGASDSSKAFALAHCPDQEIPAALSAVTMKALARRKAQRYQTVAELAADITAYQGGFATSAEEAGVLKEVQLFIRRHRILAAAAALVFVTIIVALAFILSSERKATRHAAQATANANVAQTNATLARLEADRATKAEQVALAEQKATRQALAQAKIALAEAAYREADPRAMKASLDGVPPELRDSDWAYFHRHLDNSLAQVAHEGTSISIAAAAHPTRPGVFALTARVPYIRLVDGRTGAELSRFSLSPRQRVTKFWLFRAAFSSDGERLAVTSDDNGGVAIYHARTGEVLVEWDGHDTRFVQFSSDDTKVLVLNTRAELEVHAADSGRLLWRSKACPQARFTSAGQVLVANGRQLRLVEATTGKEIRKLPDAPAPIFRMVLGPEDKTLFFSSADDGLLLGMRLADGERVFSQRFAEARTYLYLGLTRDGRQLVAANQSPGDICRVRAWDTGSGITVQNLLGNMGAPEGLCVHPLNDYVLVTGPETRIWALTTQPSKWTVPGFERGDVFWGTDDRLISPDGPVRLRENGQWMPTERGGMLERSTKPAQPSPRPSSLLQATPPFRYAKHFASTRGDVLAVGDLVPNTNPAIRESHSTHIRVARGSEASPQILREMHWPHTTRWLRLSPDGGHVAVLDLYNSLEIFSTNHGESPVRCEAAGCFQFYDIAWLTTNRMVGVGVTGHRGQGTAEERVVLWHATTGKAMRHVPWPARMDRLASAPGHPFFAEAGADKRVRLRDPETLAIQREFRVHDAPITALALHPAKPILATGSKDLTIRLWNTGDGSLIEEFRPSIAEPVALHFSPTGSRLAATDAAGHTYIWEFIRVDSPNPGSR